MQKCKTWDWVKIHRRKGLAASGKWQQCWQLDRLTAFCMHTQYHVTTTTIKWTSSDTIYTAKCASTALYCLWCKRADRLTYSAGQLLCRSHNPQQHCPKITSCKRLLPLAAPFTNPLSRYVYYHTCSWTDVTWLLLGNLSRLNLGQFFMCNGLFDAKYSSLQVLFGILRNAVMYTTKRNNH